MFVCLCFSFTAAVKKMQTPDYRTYLRLWNQETKSKTENMKDLPKLNQVPNVVLLSRSGSQQLLYEVMIRCCDEAVLHSQLQSLFPSPLSLFLTCPNRSPGSSPLASHFVLLLFVRVSSSSCVRRCITCSARTLTSRSCTTPRPR